MVSRVPSSALPSPAREELDRKWREFAGLREQVVEAELKFQSLDAVLRTFEQNYLLRCGSRYMALDDQIQDAHERLARLKAEDTEREKGEQ